MKGHYMLILHFVSNHSLTYVISFNLWSVYLKNIPYTKETVQN